MLDYGWGNPSTIMFSGDENTQDSDQNRQIFDRYSTTFNENGIPNQHAVMTSAFSDHHFNPPPQQTHVDHIDSFFDYGTTSYFPPHPSMLTLEPVIGNSSGVAGCGGGGGEYMLVPKREDISRSMDYSSRIGLNLGGRTYFSSDDNFVNRLYRRSRPVESGSINSPKCQTEGCNADLTHAKHYHRRHKVCEFHSKASTVIAAGLTQRFCQQCSRFHLLSEFDNGKRSCRKRLADHNRRRRKTHQPPPPPPHESQKAQLQSSRNSFSDNIARSPPESGAQPISSVTVAVSPRRMSLECFRPYQATLSSASSSSLFYSGG